MVIASTLLRYPGKSLRASENGYGRLAQSKRTTGFKRHPETGERGMEVPPLTAREETDKRNAVRPNEARTIDFTAPCPPLAVRAGPLSIRSIKSRL